MAALEIALRTVLAVVFGIAFISKVRSRSAFHEFVSSLDDIGWLNRRWRPAAAALIPELEAAVVMLLVVPAAVAFGFGTAAALLVVFIAVTAAELAKGRRVRCRCFGAGTAPIGPAQIARNIVLLTVSVTGLALESVGHSRANGTGFVLAVGLGVLAALAFVRWDDLAYLLRTP